jgi:hypothetical protein
MIKYKSFINNNKILSNMISEMYEMFPNDTSISITPEII